MARPFLLKHAGKTRPKREFRTHWNLFARYWEATGTRSQAIPTRREATGTCLPPPVKSQLFGNTHVTNSRPPNLHVFRFFWAKLFIVTLLWWRPGLADTDTSGQRSWPPPLSRPSHCHYSIYLFLRVRGTGKPETGDREDQTPGRCGLPYPVSGPRPPVSRALQAPSTLTRCEHVWVDVFVRKTHATTAKARLPKGVKKSYYYRPPRILRTLSSSHFCTFRSGFALKQAVCRDSYYLFRW